MVEVVLDEEIPRRHPGGAWAVRVVGTLLVQLAAERERWGLWVPVGFAFGIASYFVLDSEPWPFLGLVVAILALGTAALARRSAHAAAPRILLVMLPIGVVAAGFAAAQLETWRNSTRMIDHPLGAVAVTGRVIDVEALVDGTRVTLMPETIEHLDPAAVPRFIRIKLKGTPSPISVGDRMSVKAELMPPAGPALPGGFDFQRQAWFRGLGAVGYALGAPSIQPGSAGGFSGRIRALRADMSERIRAALPGPGGSIAAALITGERGAIPALVNQDYRNSGLAHLLVIAGLHMTLVTGFVFFAVRGGLALIPSVALRFPIKKWAAAAALVVAALYLVVSGGAVPTQRAFVMVSFGLFAIMIDRLNVSMFAVAWAAGFVLALDPVALTGVSFQMSFAAVIGLVAFYETFGPRLSELRHGRGPFGRGLLHILGIGLTTLVTTVGTAAFSIYHFNRFAVFSIVANLVAVPLAGFWVMPWAVASCLLMPFGLEGIGLTPMGWGLDLIEQVAHWTAGLPYAVLDLPSMPDWGLIAAAVGGLWLALWRTRWRRWGLVLLALAAVSPVTATAPDILAAEDGRLLAIRSRSGGYLLSSAKTDKLAAETWLRSAGGVPAGLLPEPGEVGEEGALRCDQLGCLWHIGGHTVALVRDAAALPQDCRNADIVVALIPARRGCRATALVIDRTDLRRNGSIAMWLGPAVVLDTANGRRGERPWVLKLGPRISSAGSTRPDDPVP
jgi:competence protein ComEC